MLRCPTPPAVALTPTGSLRATVRPPGSRSITSRALVCAALAEGESHLVGASCDEDTRATVDALRRLGIPVELGRGGTRLTVYGCGGRIPVSSADLDFAGSDTAMRFVTSMAAFAPGNYRLGGIPWLRQRRSEELLDTLNDLGVNAHLENENGRPVLVVDGHRFRGGATHIEQHVSAQFLSGLLMVAPHARQDVTLSLFTRVTSQPRVMMTLAVMRAFDVDVPFGPDLTQLHVDVSQSYRGRTYGIEPDATAASCFWAAAAITRGMITVEGLSIDSLQRHVAFCDCLQRMGCRVEYGANAVTVVGGQLSGTSINASSLGHTLPTIATVALFAASPTTISMAGQLPSDVENCIGHLVHELRQLGARVIESREGLQIVPENIHGAEIDTHGDSRLAMSLALAGLRVPGVVIRNPQPATKVYPTFFEELMALGD